MRSAAISSGEQITPSLERLRGDGLQALDGVLPRAALFGPNALNQVYIRSDWGPDATYVTFRAGDTFAHHGHYDAGHFTLFKGAPLAINSGTYGDFFGERFAAEAGIGAGG